MGSRKDCFVICAIGQPGSAERKHSDIVLNYIIKEQVENAGYTVRRGDQAEHSGMITVDTINSILDSELVIADLTFHNPNVFYELGLRHSTKRHTIHMASSDTDIPFDNADHRTIFYDVSDWDSHNNCRAALANHLKHLDKSYVTNPVSIAQAHKNDAGLHGVINGLRRYVVQLEERVKEVAVMPPPGQITRKQYKSIVGKHRDEILQVVKAIRKRIDQPKIVMTQAHSDASDVLTRLNAIESVLDSKVANLQGDGTTIQ